VQIDDEHLLANYGPWRLRTRLTNISRVTITARTGSTGPQDRHGWESPTLADVREQRRSSVLVSFHERVLAIGSPQAYPAPGVDGDGR
jgi:hypothetical protein